MSTTPNGDRPLVHWHDETSTAATTTEQIPDHPEDRRSEEPHGHGRGHGLMMLLCCVPMLLIVFVLVATGAAGTGAIAYALLCTAMMAAMMFFMPGHRH
ncbi:hypothetical protein [Arsenicicoccus bolidensis]|uniref:hypothetical protein n=1 Tax=Arsenicicoccus bolidensis TaxID=229480 RepID=UPI000413FCD4|nr:hypothetical protein [Arsenicicoccus bolidensis]